MFEFIAFNSLNNAVGILKEELRLLDSLIIKAADATSVPAGSALAVDRESFSHYITDTIRNHENITVINEEITEIPEGPCIIATGPLTSDDLAKAICEYLHTGTLHFYDAAAPIVEKTVSILIKLIISLVMIKERLVISIVRWMHKSLNSFMMP